MHPRFRVQAAVQTPTTHLDLPFYPPALRESEQTSVTRLQFFDADDDVSRYMLFLSSLCLTCYTQTSVTKAAPRVLGEPNGDTKYASAVKATSKQHSYRPPVDSGFESNSLPQVGPDTAHQSDLQSG